VIFNTISTGYDFELRLGVEAPGAIDIDMLFVVERDGQATALGAFEVIGLGEHGPERARSRAELVAWLGQAEVYRIEETGTAHYRAKFHPEEEGR